MDYHIEQLQKHCRICGKRLCKAKGKKQPVYSCIDHREDILSLAGLDISSDDAVIAPSKFCNPCHLRINRAKKARLSGFPYPPVQAMAWIPHQEICIVRNTSIKLNIACQFKEKILIKNQENFKKFQCLKNQLFK